MNDSTAALIGMLLAAGVGVAAGWAIGDLTRRYRQGVQQLDALRRQLPQPYSAVLFQERQLKEIRAAIHRVIASVDAGASSTMPTRCWSLLQKPSKNSPSKPHKIIVRSS